MSRLTRIVAAALSISAFAPAWPALGQDPGELAKVKQRGTLVMVCFPHQENPFVSVNLDHGPMHKVGGVEDFRGLDIDLQAGFARSLGVTLEIRPVSKPGYDELIPDLLDGKGDLIASSFTITPSRAAKVVFSEPYYTVPEVVVVRKGSSIKTEADVAGKKAATVRGSAQSELLRRLGVKEDDLLYVEFTRDNYVAVADGQTELTLLDGTSVRRILKEFESLEIAFSVGAGISYGVAFRKGSDLAPAFNSYLATLKSSGALESMTLRWVEPWKR